MGRSHRDEANDKAVAHGINAEAEAEAEDNSEAVAAGICAAQQLWRRLLALPFRHQLA